MSHSNSKLNNKTPLLVHFIGHEKERLRKLAVIEQHSLSNLAGSASGTGWRVWNANTHKFSNLIESEKANTLRLNLSPIALSRWHTQTPGQRASR
jgi:hypothetical protein